MDPEKFVDSITAAKFLSVMPRRLLDMARAREVPAHPIGTGARKTWRFRLSELESALSQHEASTPTIPLASRANRSRQSLLTENGQ
jgi:hypothetical protein